jgi:hypothetical protein
MRKIAVALAILGTTLVSVLYTAPAHAQATRTWVSGVGDDANPCSRTAPCKTWAGAIVKTSAGGEIDNLDAGGFGGLTITKSITLDGGGGAVASTLVSGTNGINVAAGSTDIVIIKNIRFQGLLGNGSSPGTAGITGLGYSSGAQVIVDNCAFIGFNTNGISVSLSATGNLLVTNSTFRNNGVNDIGVTTSSGQAVATIVNSSFIGNLSSAGGVLAGANSVVAVSHSDFTNFQVAVGANGNGNLSIDNSLFMRNGTAVSSGSGTTVNVTNNTLMFNVTAFTVAGTFASAKNNILGFGSGTGSPNQTLTPQ